MTDFVGAFLPATSNYPGQIQATIIETISKSVLTCLNNNEKNLGNHLNKMLPRVRPPFYSDETWPRLGAEFVLVLCVAKFTLFASKFGKGTRTRAILDILISFNTRLFKSWIF